MARSIYCSFCKKEKGPGRENESSCKPCKSQRAKDRRAAARIEKGLRPFGSGRKLECSTCGAIKENPKNGLCKACDKAQAQRKRDEAKAKRPPKPTTCACGNARLPGRTICQRCATNASKEWRKKHGFTPDEIAKRKEYQKRKRQENSRGRVRKKGTLINGKPVNCKECDKLSQGWCNKCDELYEYRKSLYHNNEDYKFKHKIRALTRGFIKAGLLVKEPCEACQSEENVEAHHKDYTKPMDITWLCRLCHNELHHP